MFRAVNRVMEGGHDPRRFAADLLDRFRDLIVLAAVPGAGQTGLLDMPADRLDRMTGQAGRFGQAELTRAAEIISEGLIQMRGATSPRLLLELMCAQILLPAASSGEKALLVRLERLERRLEGGGAVLSGSGGPAGSHGLPAGPLSSGPLPSAPAASAASAATAGAPPAPDAPPPAAPTAAPARPSAAQAPASAQAPAPAPAAPAPPAGAGAPAARAARGPPSPVRLLLPVPGPSASSRGGAAAPSPASAAPAPSPVASAAPAAPAGQSATAAASDVEAVRQRWPEILEAVKGKRRVAWMLLSNATVHSVEGGVLTVLFAREGEAKGFAASGYDRDLISVLTSVLGLNLRIKPMSAAQLASTPGAPRSPHGGPDELSAKAPAAVQMPPEPPDDPEPPATLSAEAQHDSAPAQPVSESLTGMDLVARELGGRVIAEIDEP